MRLELVKDWPGGLMPGAKDRLRREREFLPAALEIIETPASPAGRIIALTISVAAVVALLWSYFGKVDVIATAPGKIVPIGNTKIIQPLDVGLVKVIRVADGDYVKAGQILIELDTTQAKASRDQYAEELRRSKLQLSVVRNLWNALKSGKEPSLAVAEDGAAPDELSVAQSSIMSRYEEQQAALAGLDQEIAQKAAETATSQSSIEKLQASLPFVQQQADLRSELMKLQYTSKLAYLQAQQAVVEQTQQIAVLQNEKIQAVAEQNSLLHKREEAVETYEKNLLDDLNKSGAGVSELRANLIKAEALLAAKTLRAPVAGAVQELAVHTVGGVVTPAQPLLTVVPNGGELVVEAMVNNRDVGFVHVGQTARVKIDTFSFTRYGLIDGAVVGLSRDAVNQGRQDQLRVDSNNSSSGATKSQPAEPAYIARIRLSRNWMDTETGRTDLGPGMAVTAEIQTGKRRIIDYLLSPLQGEVKDSMHER